jgi:hypothetical protein
MINNADVNARSNTVKIKHLLFWDDAIITSCPVGAEGIRNYFHVLPVRL